MALWLVMVLNIQFFRKKIQEDYKNDIMFSLDKTFPDSFLLWNSDSGLPLPVKIGGGKKPYCFSLAVVGRCLAFATYEIFIYSGHSLMNLLHSVFLFPSVSYLD